jgi:hypothetical protein
MLVAIFSLSTPLMNSRPLAGLALLLILSGYAGLAQADGSDLKATFQASTQALFNAITSGDKGPWDKVMDPTCVITSEDGEVEGKKKFLDELIPLPKGFVGAGTIVDLTVRDLGSVAVVHYFIDETEDIFEQHLKTRYVETDTYQRQAGAWKMVAMQVTVVPRNLEPIAVDKSNWPALLGDYHFPGDDKVRLKVFMRGNRVMGGKDEASAKELIPLSPLVFYQEGSIHIYVFVQAGGVVTEVRELHKYNEVRIVHGPAKAH